MGISCVEHIILSNPNHSCIFGYFFFFRIPPHVEGDWTQYLWAIKIREGGGGKKKEKKKRGK